MNQLACQNMFLLVEADALQIAFNKHCQMKLYQEALLVMN